MENITGISEIQVMRSKAGFYLGQSCFVARKGYEELLELSEKPYSRLSGYFATREIADAHLKRTETGE